MSTTTNTTTSVKVTNVSALQYVLDHCEMPAEVSEKVTNILNSYVKRSEYKSEKKTTPASEKPENVALYGQIVDYLAENGKSTIAEIIKGLGNPDLSTSKVSSLLKPYIADGTIVREEIKRKPYFSLAD